MLGIADCLDRDPVNLSGEEKQRVAIARAMMYVDSVLLLDEPFRALEEALKTRVVQILKSFSDDYAVSIICVSHNSRGLEHLDSEEWRIQDNELRSKSSSSQREKMKDGEAKRKRKYNGRKNK